MEFALSMCAVVFMKLQCFYQPTEHILIAILPFPSKREHRLKSLLKVHCCQLDMCMNLRLDWQREGGALGQ